MADIPQGFIRLAGSERRLPPHARWIEPVDPQQRIEVSVYVRDPAPDDQAGNVDVYARRPGPQVSREEYIARHSADPNDIAVIERFAREHHLTVVDVDPTSRKIVLSGTVHHLTTAFATQLHHYEHEGVRFRGRSGYLHVPDYVDQIVTGVFGLDDRPQARAHLRFSPLAAPRNAYTLPQLTQLYDFPTGIDGSGECIGLIELGGGYNDQDLITFFQQLDLTKPQILSVSVDGAQNSPSGDPNSADGEVALDIEVVGAVAPGRASLCTSRQILTVAFWMRLLRPSTIRRIIRRSFQSAGAGLKQAGPARL